MSSPNHEISKWVVEDKDVEHFYAECCKSHWNLGGEIDGCQEFEGNPEDPLFCLICKCHQGFHRKVMPEYIEEVVYTKCHNTHHNHNSYLYYIDGCQLFMPGGRRRGSSPDNCNLCGCRKEFHHNFMAKQVIHSGGDYYAECHKTHSSYGRKVDGCQMFQENPKEPLVCLICKCHQSFHRKVLSRYPKEVYSKCQKVQKNTDPNSIDGCQEFKPGEYGSNCAFCGCVKGFHRLEIIKHGGIKYGVIKKENDSGVGGSSVKKQSAT